MDTPQDPYEAEEQTLYAPAVIMVRPELVERAREFFGEHIKVVPYDLPQRGEEPR